MSNANKSKGTKHETILTRAFNAFGIAARRVAQAGIQDAGDLHGLSPFVGQAKDWKSWQDAIREGLDGAQKQRLVAREPYGVAFVKRARRSVGDGYAVTTVATFARILLRLRRAEALLAEHAPRVFELHRHATAEENAREFPRGTAPAQEGTTP